MEKYGNDRPDLRFNLELKTITEIFKDTKFKVLKTLLVLMVQLNVLKLMAQV